jgi:hypothetical protein
MLHQAQAQRLGLLVARGAAGPQGRAGLRRRLRLWLRRPGLRRHRKPAYVGQRVRQLKELLRRG